MSSGYLAQAAGPTPLTVLKERPMVDALFLVVTLALLAKVLARI